MSIRQIEEMYEEAFKRMRLEYKDMTLSDMVTIGKHKEIFMKLLDGGDRENYNNDAKMVISNYTFGNHDKRYSAYCPSCNSDLEDGRKYPTPYKRCNNCGQKLLWE